MIVKSGHFGSAAIRQFIQVAFVAMLCMAVSTPALSQVDDDAARQDRAASEELYQRFEAELRRQQQVKAEKDRLQRQRLQIETERLRQENERREQERLQLEIEGLRQENEYRKLEQLRLEKAALERKRQQLAAIESGQNDSPDIYEQLRAIGQLRTSRILTEEEFQRLKKMILE